MQQETVIVLDFGGQYNQLIARRVRECNVYCEIYSYRTDLAKIKAKNPKGIIFTGGPNSAYLPDSPTIDPEIYNWGVPILGICYGSQLMMHMLGGKVCKAPEREYGKTLVDLDTASPLFDTLPANQTVKQIIPAEMLGGSRAADGRDVLRHNLATFVLMYGIREEFLVHKLAYDFRNRVDAVESPVVFLLGNSVEEQIPRFVGKLEIHLLKLDRCPATYFFLRKRRERKEGDGHHVSDRAVNLLLHLAVDIRNTEEVEDIFPFLTQRAKHIAECRGSRFVHHFANVQTSNSKRAFWDKNLFDIPDGNLAVPFMFGGSEHHRAGVLAIEQVQRRNQLGEQLQIILQTVSIVNRKQVGTGKQYVRRFAGNNHRRDRYDFFRQFFERVAACNGIDLLSHLFKRQRHALLAAPTSGSVPVVIVVIIKVCCASSRMPRP